MEAPHAAPPRIRIEFPAYARKLTRRPRYLVLYGGRGGARSWTFARRALVLAAKERCRFLMCRELQVSIKDSVHQLLADQIELLQLPGFHILEKSIRHRVTGSTFGFEGLRYNANRIKSYEGANICWVEEAEKVSKRSWEYLIPTIRRPGSQIWVSFNPDEENDPTYQRFIVNTPPDAVVLKVGWEDNRWLPDELRKEKDYLYQNDPDAAGNVWGGATRQHSDAQIFKGKWRVEAFEPREDWDGPYQGADWGFAVHPTTLVRFWVYDRKLWIEWEAYGIGVDVGPATSTLFERIPGARQYFIRADNARPETISAMRNEGWKIGPADKWPGSVEDGIQHLRSYEEIVIHPRCTHAIDEARLYSYKTDRLTGDVLPDIVKKHDHIWDAVRYGASPMIRKREQWGPV